MRELNAKKKALLCFLTVFVLVAVLLLDVFKVQKKDDNYDLKVEAATTMQAATAAIRSKKQELGIPLDPTVDFNDTGMIGEGYTPMTTTLGSVEAKRTSVNPDMAAMVVDMLCEVGLTKGDMIAVNFSSSFPALNLAVLSACKAMEITPIVINSVGASTYGANNVDFIYLEMEKLVYDLGIIRDRSIAASVGGANDVGQEMDAETLQKIKSKIKALDIVFIEEPDFKENRKQRLAIYDNYSKKYKCFVNVGGNLISEGKNEEMINLPGGVQTRKNISLNEKSGLIEVFLNKGLPVIHLLNIKDLAVNYGIPVDPVGFGTIGESAVYYTYGYDKPLVALVLLIVVATLYRYKKGQKPYEKNG